MGCVLEAEDCKLGRIVAMKVMRLEGSASESARTRFIREATVLARLEHPNIVPIHELGWDEQNRLYYTMKLVQGRTLQAILNGLAARDADFLGHYTLDRLLTIFRKICDAMSLAHARGVIHRDLKPDNIMVGEFGEVLVMDWGLARIQADAQQAAQEAAMKAEATQPGSAGRFRELADSELRRSDGLTLDGAVMGTPRYMSPEQAEGRIAEIDQQSDIFSLGGILYAILTLHPPVDGKTAIEILSRITQGQILPPTMYNAPSRQSGRGKSPDGAAADPKKFQPLPHCPHGKVPSSLSAVTMRALSVDKSRRYKTVAEMAADIEAYQGGFATRAEQAGLFTQLRLLIQRHKREFAIAFAAWFVITALAVWFVISLRASELETRKQAKIAGENEKTAVAEAARATAAEQTALASEAEAVREKESARHSLAQSALSLAEAARREGNGPEMQAALGNVPEDLRDSTWNYLLEQSDTSIARIRSSGPNVHIEAAAADPRRPGVFAVIESNNRIALIDVHTGARLVDFPTSVKSSQNFPYRAIAFSPDGQRIAVGRRGTGENPIVICSALNGEELQKWTATPTTRLEFSPDGKLLLQEDTSAQPHVSVWDVSTAKAAWISDSAFGAFTSDGTQALTYSTKDNFRVVNVADGVPVRDFKPMHDVRKPLLVGASRMASFSGTGFVTVYDLRDGHVISDFLAHEGGLSFAAFAPGGEQLVTVAGLRDGRQAITLWRAGTGERLRELLGGSGFVFGIAVHPLTGELLVVGSNGRAWSLTGKAPGWQITCYAQPASPVFWGSDDFLFASRGGADCLLQKLQGANSTVIWKPADLAPRQVDVSADGEIAVVSCVSIATAGPSLSFVRNPGPNPEEVYTIKLARNSDRIRISPAGDCAAVSLYSLSQVELYGPAIGEKPLRLERADGGRTRDVGWLAGGKQLVGLVTARADRGEPDSEERIVLWDVATAKIIKSVTNRTAMDVLAVAPDGSRFAEAGADKMVRIRDAATLAVLREFRVHDEPITAIAWHPGKPILATASADLTVKLWNLETGRQLEEFRGPVYAPQGLAFSHSGQRLACCSLSDGTRIWEPQSLSDQPAATQPADAWEDLLATLTTSSVEQTGNGWRMDNGALLSPEKKTAILALPGNFAGTGYRLRVKLRQLAPKNCFHLGLPVANRMVGFELDGFPREGFYTGLTNVNGKVSSELPGALHDKHVNDSEQHDLELNVRIFGASTIITATLDAQPLYEWSGSIAALGENSSWHSTAGGLSMGTMAADWVVYEVKLQRQ
jgi:serine/threonine protein kinase/WD40 repeat protein